jgi:hypothetical protein
MEKVQVQGDMIDSDASRHVACCFALPCYPYHEGKQRAQAMFLNTQNNFQETGKHKLANKKQGTQYDKIEQV